jgi:non-homologous end joining protein Ku
MPRGSFDHSAYHDRYRERLMAVVDKKRKGETITAPEARERRAPDDLMAALEESLSAAVAKSGKAPKARTNAQPKRTRAKPRSTA